MGLCVPLGGFLAVLAVTLGPACGTRLGGLWRRTKRVFGSQPHPVHYDSDRAIIAHEPWLERLMQDTRSVLQDMDHVASQSEWWPSDDLGEGWFARLRSRIAPATNDELAGFAAVNRVTRDVWDWLRTVEVLSDAQQSYLKDRGIHVGRLREVLLADGDFHGRFASMVRLLRSFEDGLFAPPPDPFRGVRPMHASGSAGPPVGIASGPEDPPGEREPHERRYAQLIDEHGPALRALAAKYARTSDDREDLVQDMTLAIWKALPSFRGASSPTTYILRIARNTGIDHLRRNRALLPEVDAEDRSASPEERVAWARVNERLQRAIGDLPEMLRQVFELHLEGHGYDEISRRIGISQSNVGVRLTRARHRLRRRLGHLAGVA